MCIDPSWFKMAATLFDLEISIPTANIDIPSFVSIYGYPAFPKVRTYSIVKRELCPNLLNRAQNNGGWLTHLSAGVVSQSESSSDHTSILKGKSKAG